MANNLSARYSHDEFIKLPADHRIGIVISDGMWYSFPKWKKMAKVSEPELTEWIEENLETGRLIQAGEGAKSYRFSSSSIREWYQENHYTLGDQLVNFVFPPRLWNGKTETEMFLNAPLRQVGIVSFSCNTDVADEIREELRGIARVREIQPNQYKAYCLDFTLVRNIVQEIFKQKAPQEIGKIYAKKTPIRRRELADLPKDFNESLINFYRTFSKSLVKKNMETIKIFLPEPEDQDAQIILWVIEAIEKYDEDTTIPFSGYLDYVLKRWPFDLPSIYLSKDLSTFQRSRSKALKRLKDENPEQSNFSLQQLATEMEMDFDKFKDLEEKHKFWLASRAATTLTWVENSEERYSRSLIQDDSQGANTSNDVALANKISRSVVEAAIKTGKYDDAFRLIPEINTDNVNISSVREISEEFIQALGLELGIES